MRQEQETLLPCTACNSEYHKECHKFIWGRGPSGEPAPWCLECYADWKDEGFMNIHSTCLLSRGGYDTNYDPDARATARKHDALPSPRQLLGRPQIRSTRKLSCKLQRPFQDCVGIQLRGNRACKLACHQKITAERRQAMRDAYNDLREGLKTKAKLRSYQLLFSLIKTEHDVKAGMQTSYFLHGGQGMVNVCRSFWAKTFGVGHFVVQGLTKLSITDFAVCSSFVNCLVLPCLMLSSLRRFPTTISVVKVESRHAKEH